GDRGRAAHRVCCKRARHLRDDTEWVRGKRGRHLLEWNSRGGVLLRGQRHTAREEENGRQQRARLWREYRERRLHFWRPEGGRKCGLYSAGAPMLPRRAEFRREHVVRATI